MTPFRVPSTGGTQIGAMWIEQQRAESCRGHGAGKGGQLAAARGGGVALAELSASQAGVGAFAKDGVDTNSTTRSSGHSYSKQNEPQGQERAQRQPPRIRCGGLLAATSDSGWLPLCSFLPLRLILLAVGMPGRAGGRVCIDPVLRE